MTNIIEVKFKDFKTLCKDKRIYYYIDELYFEFYFTSDGTFVKSTIQKNEIDMDLKRFFSDKMFYGAMEIKFSIDIRDVNTPTEMSPSLIELFQAEEVKNDDIQQNGVLEDD